MIAIFMFYARCVLLKSPKAAMVELFRFLWPEPKEAPRAPIEFLVVYNPYSALGESLKAHYELMVERGELDSDRFLWVELDSTEGLKVHREHSVKHLPTLLVFDWTGEELHRVEGSHLLEFLKDTCTEA